MFRRFRFPLALKNGSTYFLVFALLGALGCFQNPQQAKKRYFESGQGYFAQKKYHEAVIQFKNALQADPNYVEAHYQLGLAYLGLARYREAYQEFVNTTNLDNNHLNAHLNQGNMLLLSQRFDEAKAKAELTLEKDPQNIKGLILLGNSYAGLKDLDRAIEELQRAVEA